MAATMLTVPAGTCIYGLDYKSEGELRMQSWRGAGAGASTHVPRGVLGPVVEACRALVAKAAPPGGRAAAARRLPALLQRADVRAALAGAAATEGEAGGPATEALVCAAWAGRDDLLAALTAAGARVTVHTLAAAFPLRLGAGVFPDGALCAPGVDASRCDPLRAVRLLLAHGGAAAAAAPLPPGGKPHFHPMLRLLADLKAERGEWGIWVSETQETVTRAWFARELEGLEATALRYLQARTQGLGLGMLARALLQSGVAVEVAEELVGAGWGWPAELRRVTVRGQLAQRFDPLSEPGVLRFVQTDARWLYLAAKNPAWSPTLHRAFPPRFRSGGGFAARALLLSAARRGSPLQGRALQALLGEAAYPLSAWRPAVVEGRAAADALFAAFTDRKSFEVMGVEMKTILSGMPSVPPDLAAALGGLGISFGGGIFGATMGGLGGGGSAGPGAGAGAGPRPAQAGQQSQPAAQAQPKACAACGATGDLRRCGDCRGVRYCGAECQRAHWPQHKAECRRRRTERRTGGTA